MDNLLPEEQAALSNLCCKDGEPDNGCAICQPLYAAYKRLSALRSQAKSKHEFAAEHAIAVDRAFVNGLSLGWNFGITDDRAGYLQAQECRNREIRAASAELRAQEPAPPKAGE